MPLETIQETALPRSRRSPFAPIDRELVDLSRRVGLLGAATPRDAHRERQRLLADFSRGLERLPRWTYEAAPRTDVLRGLKAVEGRLRARDDAGLANLYRARVDELRQEALAAEVVGTPAFAESALSRFAPGSAESEAGHLARAWLEQEAEPRESQPATVRVRSDERDPRSLVSRLRAEVMRRRLLFRVEVNPGLSSLAAVSGDTLWVAEGRLLSLEDIERTALHEIEAHVIPRVRASRLALGLFAIGTARGTDDQEGYALWLEAQRGFSSVERRRELGARHIAVLLMHEGADFVAVVRTLRKDGGLSLDASLRIAERVFRGSHGQTPGLGRERVYLEAFLRVKEYLAHRPLDESLLRAGQVSLHAIPTLRPWALPAQTSTAEQNDGLGCLTDT